MSGRAKLAPLTAVAFVLAPRLARACAVCMSGREDDVQLAFIATTVLLSLLPLLAVGGFVWWVRRRLRQIERDQAERLATVRPAGVAD